MDRGRSKHWRVRWVNVPTARRSERGGDRAGEGAIFFMVKTKEMDFRGGELIWRTYNRRERGASGKKREGGKKKKLKKTAKKLISEKTKQKEKGWVRFDGFSGKNPSRGRIVLRCKTVRAKQTTAKK